MSSKKIQISKLWKNPKFLDLREKIKTRQLSSHCGLIEVHWQDDEYMQRDEIKLPRWPFNILKPCVWHKFVKPLKKKKKNKKSRTLVTVKVVLDEEQKNEEVPKQQTKRKPAGDTHWGHTILIAPYGNILTI